MTNTTLTLLDGGMGQELLKRTGVEPTNLWSAKFTLENPAVVQEVHEVYLAAGADVITVNTYTATPSRFARDSDVALLPKIYENAWMAASRARQNYPKAKIAGCLPPLMASYAVVELPTFDQCVQEYRQIIALQPEVDLFIIETMSNLTEAKAALSACQDLEKPVWISFSISDDIPTQLRQGESVDEAMALVCEYKPAAVLVNCSSPEAILQNTAQLATYTGQCGAYGNAFTNVKALKPGGTVADLEVRDNLGPDQYLAEVKKWVAAGLTLVGGCCEIGPDHIKAIDTWRKSQGNTP